MFDSHSKVRNRDLQSDGSLHKLTATLQIASLCTCAVCSPVVPRMQFYDSYMEQFPIGPINHIGLPESTLPKEVSAH